MVMKFEIITYKKYLDTIYQGLHSDNIISKKNNHDDLICQDIHVPGKHTFSNEHQMCKIEFTIDENTHDDVQAIIHEIKTIINKKTDEYELNVYNLTFQTYKLN
jgi:hypothetical protein